MLTKTESTALLRHLYKGLKNNTISKAHGRQLMDLAEKVRSQYKASKNITDKVQSFFRPTKSLWDKQIDFDSRIDVPDSIKKKYLSFLQNNKQRDLELRHIKNFYSDGRIPEWDKEKYLSLLQYFKKREGSSRLLQNSMKRAMQRALKQEAKEQAQRRYSPKILHRTVGTPIQDLLKNPANKVISKGTFNGQKVDPYRRGFAGKDANTFGEYFIKKDDAPYSRRSQLITAYPQIAGGYTGGYNFGQARGPVSDIVLEYDMTKLRDKSAPGWPPKRSPLVWTPHQAIDAAPSSRQKMHFKYGSTGNNKEWSGLPYYQTIAVNQPGYTFWNAIKNIYKPMTDAKGHKQYLKLDNWRDAFRPSKTLDMYTQLYS